MLSNKVGVCASRLPELTAHLPLITDPNILHNCPLFAVDVSSLMYKKLMLSLWKCVVRKCLN